MIRSIVWPLGDAVVAATLVAIIDLLLLVVFGSTDDNEELTGFFLLLALPNMILALFCGFCFGMAKVTSRPRHRG